MTGLGERGGTGLYEAGVVKACCAATYSSDLVAMLLGEAYHPGGLALTRALGRAMGLRAGGALLDVAAGRGASAAVLAAEFDVDVHGVDLSHDNAAHARLTAVAAGVADRVRHGAADAERLPFAAEAFDAAVCECALCTFPDKRAALGEIARVLRPGGVLGMTDVVVEPDRLPEQLTSLGAWVACVADARPADEYAALLDAAGLRVEHVERHDDAIARMVEQIGARVEVLRMTAREQAESLGLDFDRATPVLDAAADATRSGVLGYALLTARKAVR